MENFVIMTDSSCDLTTKLADRMQIKIIPLTVVIDGQQYYNYLDGREIGFNDFYAQLAEGKMVTTSAANVEQFREAMEEELAAGKDVLYLGFSSALSATFNCGRQAAEKLSEKYPDRKIYAVDTLAASMGQGLLVYHAYLEQQKGRSIDDVRDWVEENKLNLCHWFTVNDLYQLKRGGRISGVTAVLGTMLSIKPVLHVDNEGRLINMFKARGRNSSINALFEKMKESAIPSRNQTVFISHGDCFDDAKKLANMIKQEFDCKVVINYVGPVIGAHSGQGTLALFFIGKER